MADWRLSVAVKKIERRSYSKASGRGNPGGSRAANGLDPLEDARAAGTSAHKVYASQ